MSTWTCFNDLSFFDKISALLAWSETLTTWDKSASSSTIKNEYMPNQELAKDLHNPIIRKCRTQKV